MVKKWASMADFHDKLFSHPSWPGCQLLLVRHTKCMEMATVVNKIACRLCTACPPAVISRLDTISSATVYSQYIEVLRTRQKRDKFYCHDCGTLARPTKKPTYTASPSTASKDDVPKASLQSRTLTVLKLKVLSRNHDHHSRTLRF